MLLPKKTKYRKYQRGRRRGMTKGQDTVQFGDFGLKATGVAWLTNREIAETLFLSEGTVKFHVHHILEKLQARTRSQAIAIARNHVTTCAISQVVPMLGATSILGR